MKYLAPLLALSALVMTSTSSGAQQQKATSVVLVHGAFVDGSGWQAVYDLLKKDGYEVLVVQNPTITLEGDVAATEAVIAAAKYPVVLVGHSYGGMVITQAGENPKVKSLAYIAAFAPDTGESAASLNSWPAEPGEVKAPLLPPQNGYLLVDPAKFPTSFAADSPVALTEFMAAAQVPWGLHAVEAKVTKVGWKAKPSVFLIPSQDRMITPSSQRKMAKRSGARVEEISSSHAVMLSHPREVAAFIESADR
nr:MULTISPECIES: alpha/beta hydrolase [unclassified Bradyrhizobium]